MEYTIDYKNNVKPGTKFNTKKSGELIVLGKLLKSPNKNAHYVIQFIKTKTIKSATLSQLKSGEILDPLVPTVNGVGIYGIGKYSHKNNSKLYTLWVNMIQRCHSLDYLKKHPSYKKVSICSKWYNFQNFCEDIEQLDNYNEWLNCTDKSLVFDKDLLQQNTEFKIYSKTTTCFILNSLNTIMSNVSKNSYLAVSPDGIVYTFTNQKDFAQLHGLERKGISAVISGIQSTHKKWKFEKK